MKKIQTRLAVIIISLAFFCPFMGCSGATGGTETGTTNPNLQFSVRASNGGSAVSASGLSGLIVSGGPSDEVLSSSDFVSTSITSGPPTTLSLTITKMSLEGSSSVPIFDHASGKTITITGSQVDLSDMFTQFDCIDNNGTAYTLQTGESCDCGFDAGNHPLGKVTDPQSGLEVCPFDIAGYTGGQGSGSKVASLNADAGAYTSLRVTFQRKATVSGCLTGRYGAPDSVISSTHTYCTQAAKSFFNGTGGGQNSDFENKTAEEMDFDLVSPGGDSFSTDTFDVDFPIQGGLNLTSSGTTSLSLLIDTNRMLRFYNQAIAQAVNPGAPTNVSYFFTTIFRSSIYLFAGLPGNIYGYELITRACTNVEEAALPSDYVCPDGTVVAAWLTLITNSQGTPIIASFMPDDDNTLTVIKGSNMATGGSGGQTWDASLITENASGNFDISYRLGTETEAGTVFNMSTGAGVGDTLADVKFRGFQMSYGTVTATRKL